MEGRLRRSFTEEYKRQAVELVVSSGRSITSVAEELGLPRFGAAAVGREARAGADGGGAARGSGRSGRRLLRLDAFEGASLVENRPRDPGELVGERNRQHVVVQSFLGGFDPRFEAIALPTLDLDQHNPRGFHEQRAQVAIAAP